MRVALFLALGVALGTAGCGGTDSAQKLQSEKEAMLAPTDMSKLTPEMKEKVDAIMAGQRAASQAQPAPR